MVYNLQSVDEAERAEELRQIRTLRRSVLLWIVALGLALLVVVLLIVANTLQAEADRMENELSGLQDQLARLQGTSPAVQVVLDEVDALREQVTTIEAAALPPNINWPQIILAIDSYDRTRIALEALSQTEVGVTLSGVAADDEAVIDYAQLLADTPQVDSVEIQSIRTIPPPAQAETAYSVPSGDVAGETLGDSPTESASDAGVSMNVAFVLTMVLDASQQ